MLLRAEDSEYLILIFFGKSRCILKKKMNYENRVTTVLKILKNTYRNSNIVVADKFGNVWHIDKWLSFSR